jgi:PII-like signaling protein
VTEDCLKLTTYFGERDRVDGRLLADELLDLYGTRRVLSSALLRGAEGFGRLHHRHTDRLLSLSEDLPVVSIAVDRRDRIEALLASVQEIQRRGMITLERARLVSGEVAVAELPESLGEEVKLTVYLGRQERALGMPAFAAVCELLHRRGIAGATALIGVDGTSNGRRTRARFFGRNADVPMMVIAVGSGERIAQTLPELSGLLSDPLATLERARVCKRDGQLLARPPTLPARDEDGRELWQKLTVYTSESATWQGRPLSQEIVRRLRGSDAAGATTLRGLWGFHGDHAPHGDRFLQLRRHVPVVTIAVDAPDRIAHSFQLIDELTTDTGLVTSETVPAMLALSASERRGGLGLARRP